MRFPLRLAASLYSQKFRRGLRSAPILYFSPLANHFGGLQREEEVTLDMEWHTPEACVAAADRAEAPVVWLGHTEPLLHPNIGKVVAALLQTGRYVFVHTSGVGLRKRIHEFQPHSRLFLAIELQTLDNSAPFGFSGEAASRHFIEAIFGAGLSGFHRCAHITATGQTDGTEIARIFDSLKAKGLEGFVVSSGGSPDTVADGSVLRKVAEITNSIPSRGWKDFSRLLENSLIAFEQPRPAVATPVHRERLHPTSTICEESALTQ